jgi:hypothetical protein
VDLATALPSTFEPLLDATFRATLPDGRQAGLVLTEVARGRSGADERPYSLTFRGGPVPPADQGIVRLEHACVGAVDLFLVPTTPDAVGPAYVAVLG